MVLSCLLVLTGCKQNNAYEEQLQDPELFHSAMSNLTDVIVYDIFSPPVASRVYMYPSVAAFSIIQKAYPDKYNSLGGQLTDLNAIPKPNNEDVDFHLASIHAFTVVGKHFIFSEQKVTDFQNETYKKLIDSGLPKKTKKASIEYGEVVAKHILEWAKGDLYNQTRTYPKYTILEDDKY